MNTWVNYHEFAKKKSATMLYIRNLRTMRKKTDYSTFSYDVVYHSILLFSGNFK